MGAKGAPCSMGTKGAGRKFLSILHPNTTFKPSPGPGAHPNPQPSPSPTPTPTPSPNPKPNPSPNPGSELLLGFKMESNGMAKAAMNEIWGILFSLINMAGMGFAARCKGWG